MQRKKERIVVLNLSVQELWHTILNELYYISLISSCFKWTVVQQLTHENREVSHISDCYQVRSSSVMSNQETDPGMVWKAKSNRVLSIMQNYY